MALVVAGVLMGVVSVRADAPAPGNALEELNRASENLTQLINKSLVRVSITQSAASVLPPDLRADFDKWTPALPVQPGLGGGGRRGGGGEGRGDRNPNRGEFGAGQGFGAAGRGGWPGGPGGPGGEPGGGMTQRVRAFIQSRIDPLKNSTSKADQDQVEQLRALLLRVDLNRGVFQGDMSAVVLDNQGHALVLTGLLRAAHSAANPMHVTLPDGTQTTASFVGANLSGNYTVIELEKFGGTFPIKWAKGKVIPGQLMMATAAGAGNSVLIVGKPADAEDHISIPVADRSGMFINDINGGLVAVVSATGGIGGERSGTTAARMEREIAYIISTGMDIEPRQLGLKFNSTYTAPGTRQVRVDDVAANSLAAAAGVKKGDILESIDGHPISELVAGNNIETPGMLQLKVDLVTRTSNVPLVVNRDGKDLTLSMPLK